MCSSVFLCSHWLLLTKGAALSVSGTPLRGAGGAPVGTVQVGRAVGLLHGRAAEPLVQAVFAVHRGQHIVQTVSV